MASKHIYGFSLAVLIMSGVYCSAAEPIDHITLPGSKLYTESITSTSDGTLIVGSLGNRNISRIAPGTTTVVEWIKPGTGDLNQVFGVFADEKANTLWVCSDRVGDAGGADPALKAFNLKTGVLKQSYPLPAEKDSFCNDIAVASDGTAYITDTHLDALYMVKPGAQQLEVAARDPMLAGADGIAFGEKNVLIVTGVTTGKLLRVSIGASGKSTGIAELKLSKPLTRPDGMRTIGKNRFLLAENSGNLDIVTIGGPSGMNAEVKTIRADVDGASATTATRSMAWVAEGKLKYWEDPKFMGKDPGTFNIYAVPLPKQ